MPCPPESLAELARLSLALDDSVVATEAVALAEQLERKELNVLVVGQFKRGKSTVVNALLDEDLMPTGALPLTGVATAVRYGANPTITVRLSSGDQRTVTPEEFALYVSERTNPKNALGVVSVDVVRPAPALRGVALFDTPGVGSIFRHNTATARAILPRADAAILVVGPEPPVGAEELSYASDVAQSSVRLFVIFNKADTAGAALDELLAFTRQAIEEVSPGAQLFPMSATLAREMQRSGATDPHFETFLQTLRSFVDERGTEALAASVERRVNALLDRTAAFLQIRSEALSLPRAERRQRRAMLESALQSLDDRVRFFELTVDDDVQRLRLRLEDELDRRHDAEQGEFVGHATLIAREPSSRRRHEALELLIRDRAQAWRQSAVARAESELADYAAKYVRLLAEIEEAVIRAGCEALRVDAGAFVPRDVAFEPAKLTLSVSIDATTSIEIVRDLATALLPRSARIHALEGRLSRALESELDALRGKLRYGIAHDLEPWRRSVRATIRSSLDGTRSAVLAAFHDTSGAHDESKAQETLARFKREFAAIRNAVAGVASP